MAGLQTAGCSCVKSKSSCDLQNLSKSLRPSSSDRVTVYFSKNYATSFLGQKLTTSCKPSSKLVSDRSLAAAVITNASLDGRNGDSSEDEMNLGVTGFPNDEFQEELANRILSGEFTVRSPKNKFSKLRRLLANLGPAGRWVAKALAISERGFMLEKSKMLPEARGDINAITGQPFFIPLYDLYRKYGGAFRLTFGPKSFVIISDPVVAKRLLKDNSKAYSKGILAEILDFVMGKGLIPADEDIWRVRRRAIVPALHRKYVTAMIKLFGLATEQLCKKLDAAAHNGEDVEMESLFSHLTLDVIGKAVFNYDFDSLSNDTGIVEAVYVALREAEARSMAIIPYWNIPIIKDLSSRQRKVADALKLINETVDKLIAVCKEMIERENVSFHDEYMNEQDPSILHFLLASGDDVSSKQLRDDLMTLLIAGHETSAAVLTWAFYLLAKNLAVTAKLQREVDSVLGDRLPTIEDMKKLKLTTRVINETLRLYPQPPVLIRRSLQEDVLGGYHIKKGEDIFISVWNLHRSPYLWEDPEEFRPERWPLDGPGPTEVTENFRYLPFGGGPRKCLGDMFATFEMITAVAMLVRRFNFELAINAPPVGMTTGATIHTTEGLNMTVTHRTKPPVIPVTTAPTLTTIDENGTLKSYQSSNGSVTVFAPDIERQEDVNCEELTK